jgi:hypothetical protein
MPPKPSMSGEADTSKHICDVVRCFPRADIVFWFRTICSFGHLRDAKQMHMAYNFTADDVKTEDNYVFRSACQGGHLHVAQWLHFTFGTAPGAVKRAYYKACQIGDLKTVQWLYHTFSTPSGDAQWGDCVALMWACNGGWLHVAQWFHQTFGVMKELKYESVLHLANADGLSHIVQWLCVTYGLEKPPRAGQQWCAASSDARPHSPRVPHGSRMPHAWYRPHCIALAAAMPDALLTDLLHVLFA